jgi:hypothetical protein
MTSAGIVPAQRAGEEPAGGGQVAALGQHDVDDLAVLVDGPVQIGPPASHLDVGLVEHGVATAEEVDVDSLGDRLRAEIVASRGVVTT